jgi:hypothetical protein
MPLQIEHEAKVHDLEAVFEAEHCEAMQLSWLGT